MPLDAVSALTRLGGVGSPGAVRKLSSRRRLQGAVARGEIIRLPGRDLVALPTTDVACDAAARVGGVLSHTTAALAMGWPVAAVPALPIITRPLHLAPLDDAPADVDLLHRSLRSRDTAGWHTSPLRTVLDCARDLPFAQALAVADSALRAKAVTYDELNAAATKAQRRRSAQVRRVARYADGRAANPFESELRALCIEVGLDVIAQYEVRASGVRIHPDLTSPLLGIIIEADSWAHHGEKRPDWVRDVTRYNALATDGWIVLRFTWEQVRFDPAYVRSVLRDAMRQVAAAS